MQQTPNRARRQGNPIWGFIRGFLLFVVALVAIRLLAGWIGSGGDLSTHSDARPKTFEALIAAYTEEHPESSHLYEALRTEFPDDYKALSDGVTSRLEKGAPRSELETFIFTSMRSFSVRHASDVMQAPSPQLVAMRRSQTAVLEALQMDSVKLCAAFGDSGLPAGARPNAKSMKALAAAADAQIDAIVAGHKHPTPHGAVRPSDWAALSEALDRQGLSQEQRAVLSNTNSFNAASDGEKCDIDVIIARAEEDLPPAIADRITVEQHRAVVESYKTKK